MRLILVTGGAGFIGSHLVSALVERGEKVRVVDDLSTGRLDNIRRFIDKIEWIEGDIRQPSIARRAVNGVKYVLHAAARPSVARSLTDPVSTMKTNAGGTLNLLAAARDSGVKKFVFSSSSSVYGESRTLPKTESMPLDPLSPYALSKLAGEHYCRIFADLFDLDCIVLRYFNVFGPRQDPSSQYAAVIPRFIASLLAGKELVVFGDGRQSRDFTFVENVVQANLAAMESDLKGFHVMNIASGRRVTILRLIGELESITGLKPRVRFDRPRPGDIKHSLADITRAKETLGYRVPVPFTDGLAMTVDWFRSNMPGGGSG